MGGIAVVALSALTLTSKSPFIYTVKGDLVDSNVKGDTVDSYVKGDSGVKGNSSVMEALGTLI